MIRLLISETGGTAEDAKDIFQESLIIMLEKIDSREFVLTCRFKTYIYSVCENLWKTILKRRNYLSEYRLHKKEDRKEMDAGELMDRKVNEEIFSEAFQSLDIVSKKILKLYWQEISAQEIADKLGYTCGYVRKKKCQAQAELTGKVKNDPRYRQILDSEKVAGRVVY